MSFASESEISADTGIEKDKVFELGNEMIRDDWVDVESYSDDGHWLIRLTGTGKSVLDELSVTHSKKPKL